VPRLVDALGGEEYALLEQGGRGDVRGQRRGDALLRDVERSERPQQPVLVVLIEREPVGAIVREVEIGHRPVQPLPPEVELAVGRHPPGDGIVEVVEDEVGIDVGELPQIASVLGGGHRTTSVLAEPT
jgi:hypothetical protein